MDIRWKQAWKKFGIDVDCSTRCCLTLEAVCLIAITNLMSRASLLSLRSGTFQARTLGTMKGSISDVKWGTVSCNSLKLSALFWRICPGELTVQGGDNDTTFNCSREVVFKSCALVVPLLCQRLLSIKKYTSEYLKHRTSRCRMKSWRSSISRN